MCEERAGKSGLCSRHWHRRRANGTLEHLPKCSIPKCRRCAAANGICMMHYKRQRRGSPTEPEYQRRTNNPGGPCEAPKCDRKAVARGLCSAHWDRQRDGRSLDSPVRKIRRGGERKQRMINCFGYAMIFDPKHPNATGLGYVLEHRKVMADCLGRPLLPCENVHHKNGDRADNRLVKGHELRCPGTCCNLELWSHSQPCGQRVEDKVAWAREILATYGG
jgi:hypothetical protein